MKFDTIVLGAGMVGVSTALQLQRRGRAVALIDRRPAAEETSYGNAGIIQSEAVMPYSFPRDLPTIFNYALNRAPESNLHWHALPELAPWLYRTWREGSAHRTMKTALAMHPLIERCLDAHKSWISEAGMEHLLSATGYLQLYRDAAKLDATTAAKTRTRERFGITFKRLEPTAIRQLEPNLTGEFAGAFHIDQPESITDPGALGKAYADMFTQAGGVFRTADADTLEAIAGGWQVQTVNGPIKAANAVIALGPWSGELLKPLNWRVPLVGKRGYHMHYAAEGNAGLARPVLDAEYGYVLAPMRNGIRLTTGVELAAFRAPPSPIQLENAEPVARTIFPLGERLDDKPWLGRRPCLPDMLPVIGAIPGHKGLWANFGHQHLGFTLGPITAQLLAEMMTGEPTFTDPAPYRIDRF